MTSSSLLLLPSRLLASSRLLACLLLAPSLALAGESVAEVGAQEAPTATPKEARPAAERITPVSLEQFQAVLAEHRGSPVVVNLWATWCIPCVQELPDLELLQKRYRDQGLVVLPVSLDAVSKGVETIGAFLEERAPELTSFLQTEDDEYVFVTALDEEWFGVLPTTFFFDRDGVRVETHSGRLLYKDFERRIRPLLESP